MNYNKRSRELGRDMAKCAYDNIDSHIWACKSEEEKQRTIDNYKPLAEIALKYAAKEATNAYHEGVGGQAFLFAVREYLESHGLIEY